MRNSITRILLVATLLLGMGSCDKMEDNGNFAGLWYLNEWKSLPDGEIKADKQNRIFYAVQLDLMNFRGGGHGSYLSRFRRTTDSLFIGTVYHGSKDEIVDITELAPFGVPADGKFAIDKLSKQTLVLRSDDAVLTFRKY